MWRRNDLVPFFRTLRDRARKKYQREGISPFEIGDPRTLHALQDQAAVLQRRLEMVIVQPGLSATKASPQQLDLLASTQAYLRTTVGAPVTVWCNS
jgi:hypothetical protein